MMRTKAHASDPSARFFARLQTIGIVILLAAVASIPISVGVGTWLAHQRMQAEWDIAGPACPRVPRISPAGLGAKPPRPFVYQGVAIAYQIGDVNCETLPEPGLLKHGSYPICVFDAPAGIAVTTRGRTTFFEPGVGHPATVKIRHGQASCVLSGSL